MMTQIHGRKIIEFNRNIYDQSNSNDEPGIASQDLQMAINTVLTGRQAALQFKAQFQPPWERM